MTRKLFLFIWCLLAALGVLAKALRLVRVVFRFLKISFLGTFYQAPNSKPRPLTDSASFALLFWSLWFPWRSAVVVVKAETLISWDRRAFQLFWRWTSRGCPSSEDCIMNIESRRLRRESDEVIAHHHQ
jgi:hypothetical protein